MTETRWTWTPGAREKLWRALAHGVGRLAERTAEIAAPNAPRLTGRLEESVGYVVALDGVIIDGTPAAARGIPLNGARIVAVAGADFPGRLQEEGTVKMEANPFLGPAADQVASGGDRLVVDEANERLR